MGSVSASAEDAVSEGDMGAATLFSRNAKQKEIKLAEMADNSYVDRDKGHYTREKSTEERRKGRRESKRGKGEDSGKE